MKFAEHPTPTFINITTDSVVLYYVMSLNITIIIRKIFA